MRSDTNLALGQHSTLRGQFLWISLITVIVGGTLAGELARSIEDGSGDTSSAGPEQTRSASLFRYRYRSRHQSGCTGTSNKYRTAAQVRANPVVGVLQK
jgi:hypothetical protein